MSFIKDAPAIIRDRRDWTLSLHTNANGHLSPDSKFDLYGPRSFGDDSSLRARFSNSKNKRQERPQDGKYCTCDPTPFASRRKRPGAIGGIRLQDFWAIKRDALLSWNGLSF